MKNLVYEEYAMQAYFIDQGMSTEYARYAFKFRTRMLSFKENFKGSHNTTMCSLCEKHSDHQDTIVSCEDLTSRFDNVDKLKNIYGAGPFVEEVKLLTKVMKFREKIDE